MPNLYKNYRNFPNNINTYLYKLRAIHHGLEMKCSHFIIYFSVLSFYLIFYPFFVF